MLLENKTNKKNPQHIRILNINRKYPTLYYSFESITKRKSQFVKLRIHSNAPVLHLETAFSNWSFYSLCCTQGTTDKTES